MAKPDLGLDSAKRKAVTHDIVLDDEPSAIGSNKKLKKEWSCELCQIKASSENGLNDHLNGKKHKAREARQKSEKTVKNATDAVVNTTISRVDENGVDAESKTEEQHVETMAGNGLNVTESKTEEKLIDTMIDKSVVESKNEEQLVEMMAENGVSVTESNNEKLEEMMVDKRVTESKNEEQHMEKNENVDSFESIKGAATEEVGRKSALTETIKVGGLWCELCQIGTTSKVVMEEHKKGKKHIKKMKMFNQKSLSSASSVS
ncbi:putative transcription factor C2H2 family [Medicago truncatula]|uniref:Putative transcription factor C2H2 family n=1 Tax=Medicago truncatula TaxID=3880 RepID=A0A396IGY6_MEDTR|nr:putative transcription factor C2H2 family [Medicago truncatula]